MSSPEQIRQLQERLKTWRDTLAHYLKQQAIIGTAHVLPATTHGIREAREEIANIKKTLRRWGEDVEDYPDDEVQRPSQSSPQRGEDQNSRRTENPERASTIPIPPPAGGGSEPALSPKSHPLLFWFLPVLLLAVGVGVFFVNMKICHDVIITSGIVIGIILVLLGPVSAIFPDEIKKWLKQIYSANPLLVFTAGIITILVVISVNASSVWCTLDNNGSVPPITPTPPPTLTVDGSKKEPTQSKACVDNGDNVDVKATGAVKVGPYIGYVGPDGKETMGIFKIDIDDSYDIVPGFPHGALMCRIEGNTDWLLCGNSYTFTAGRSGCLEFQINDNEKSNNSGTFSVTIQVTHP